MHDLDSVQLGSVRSAPGADSNSELLTEIFQEIDSGGRSSGYSEFEEEEEYSNEDRELAEELEVGLVEKVTELIRSGYIHLAMRAAILGGERDKNKLTNLVFFSRHPERNGRKIDLKEPGGKTLAAEWKDILEKHVKPALKAVSGSGMPPTIPTAAPYPAVNTPLPAGPGYFRQSGNNRYFGRPETIRALQAVGARWHAAHPTGPRFEIRDISKAGGGQIPPHKSHRVGLDVDIRLLRTDGKEGTSFAYTNPVYSRALTQKLVDMIRSNGVIGVKAVGFCDQEVKGVTCAGYGGHNSHMHVRFCIPSHYQDLDGDKQLKARYSGCKP